MGDTNAHESLSKHFSIASKMLSTHLMETTVHVDGSFVKPLRAQTLKLYQSKISLPGFKQNTVPFTYIESHFKSEINTLIKGFLFTNYVLTYLYDVLRAKKTLVANLPRLKKITVYPDASVDYVFDLSITENINLKEWKHFVFKSPKRKNYKDLDKQVTLFMKREHSLFKKRNIEQIEDGDWIYFKTTLLDPGNDKLDATYSNYFWMKVTVGSLIRPLIGQLLGKSVGDTFETDNLTLEESFQERVNNHYSYKVEILSISKGAYLSLESFKNNFKLKSKADIHKKLIEVFSYRNDLSQRKSIIEEVFHLFFLKHRFEVPKHIVLRKQEDILISLRQQPDYQVYKMQKNFFAQVELLAEKQLKEEILMDQIAFNEELVLEQKDMQQYLSLFNNERLKEFVYFKPIFSKLEESHSPMQPSILQQAALREKTLNYVIHTLTR